MALIAVTGGAGFLGRHVVDALIAAQHQVRVLDVVTPPAALRDHPQVHYLLGDVCDPVQVERLVADAAAVVHMAFAPPYRTLDEMHAVNVRAAAALATAAHASGVGRVVAVSSTIVNAAARTHPLGRRFPVARLDGYRRSRIAAESALAEVAIETGLDLVVVRPRTFVGPGSVGGFALVFDLVRRGAAVPLLGPGDNRYQLLDVRDLAAALAACLDAAPGTYELGAAEFATVADELTTLIGHAGTDARLVSLPAPLGRAALRGIELLGGWPLAEWHHCVAGRTDRVAAAHAAGALDWYPRHSASDALCDSYDWYLDHSGPDVTTHPVPATHRLLSRLAELLS